MFFARALRVAAAVAFASLGPLACNGLFGIEAGELATDASTGEAGADATFDALTDGSFDARSESASSLDAGDGTTGGETSGPGTDAAGDAHEGGVVTQNPTTCADALASRTYLGCDFWPTITGNDVWSIFDFAAVVANAQSVPATVSVTGPNSFQSTQVVGASSLAIFYLPWVPLLKGSDTDTCGTAIPWTEGSVIAQGSAYHLTSNLPVAVYQFNALEYAGQGGPTGKSWAACPGNTSCANDGVALGCYSFSNDASLLLPSSTWTTNYRVTTPEGFLAANLPAYFAITAATDATHVTVHVSATGAVVTTAPPPTTDGGDAATTPPGPTVPAVGAGGVLDLTLNQGDVAEIVGTPTTDLGGSLLQSDQPVQVISGISCGDVPQGNSACDHLEQTVPPAETLGQDYVVAPMTGPRGDTVGQLVRFFGNADGTTLTYDPSPAPTGCPTTLQAGQVADCGLVTSSFEVKGNHEFVVAVFMPGGSVLDPTTQPPLQEGDPSESFAVPVAQYRADYLFATPEDYDLSFVDVIGPTGVAVTLDNAALTQSFTAIGSGAYGIARVPLQKTTGGRHALVASQPVTIQVMGYGSYTSYQYPGGLNLGLIAPPPTP